MRLPDFSFSGDTLPEILSRAAEVDEAKEGAATLLERNFRSGGRIRTGQS